MEQADPVAALFANARARRIPMAAVCRRAGVDPTTPSRWRRGLNGANLATLSKLAEALNDLASEAPEQANAA